MIWRCALIALVADVGVVAGDDVAAAVAREVQPFLDRRRGSGRLEHDVHAFAVGQGADLFQPLAARLEDLRSST